MDPYYSVSPLLLPRQQLLFPKSSPHHCLLLLDVPCPDEKIFFLRFIACARPHAMNLKRFASPLALLPTCLPRGSRSQHRTPALFPFSSQLPLSPSTSSHLCGSVPCSCEPGSAVLDHTSLLGTDALVARLLLSGVSPCSVELALATWYHFNKYITCIPLCHRVKVPQFFDTTNNYKS